MKCMCQGENLVEGIVLCEAHRLEFERRLAKSLVAVPKEKPPSYFFEALVETVSSTAPRGNKFVVQLRCITQDESGMAEEHTVTVYTDEQPPAVGARYEVELKPVP